MNTFRKQINKTYDLIKMEINEYHSQTTKRTNEIQIKTKLTLLVLNAIVDLHYFLLRM
jgi:hypothetical protein